MTAPTIGIYSDVAANAYQAKVNREGVNIAQKATAAIPSSTASGTYIAMVRFQKGFCLKDLAVASDDLDSGSSVTFDIGYIYDGTTDTTSAALVSGSTIPQSGSSLIWPTAAGLLTGKSFTATTDGYLVIKTGGSSTTTTGNAYMIATFTYAF
jgi:hypothetical protein